MVEIVGQDSDTVTVKIPRSVLESQLAHVRYAQIKPEDIETILKLETLAFTPEEGGTLDPPETYEGIERFLGSGGDILIISRDNGFLEKIPLENMLGITYGDLPASSPLRQILETQALEDAQSFYSNTGKELWYVHGVGTAIKRLRDGSTMTAIALRKMFGALANEQEILDDKVHFGYIDIGPTGSSINIPSFRMFTGLGAVLDGYEPQVYSKGVPYLRVSHGVNYQLDENDKKAVDLSKRAYKHEIRKALESGYIGTQIVQNRQTETYSMVFHKNLAK